MRKTIKQLEQELAAAKQEAAMWKEAHAAALKALADAPQPVRIAPYIAPYVAPVDGPNLPWYTITCGTGDTGTYTSNAINSPLIKVQS